MKANGKHQKFKGRLAKYLLPNLGTLIILLLFILAQTVGAAPWRAPIAAPSSTTTVNYQGRLFDSSGNPVNGNVTLTFSLYDQASGGNRRWGPETHTGVPVSDGLFSVLLGSRTADGILQSALGGDLWLETDVNGETLSPREQLGAVPYAIWSQATGVPIGTVISWWRPDATTLPPSDEWAIADGSVVDDPESPYYGKQLPDLTDRFIIGVVADNIGQTGGSNTLNLSHRHTVDSHTHSMSHSHGSGTLRANVAVEHDRVYVKHYGSGFNATHANYTNATHSNTHLTDHSADVEGSTASWSGTTGASQPSTNLQLSNTTDNRPQYVGLLFLVRIK
jgi:type 1 fimbria pilin